MELLNTSPISLCLTINLGNDEISIKWFPHTFKLNTDGSFSNTYEHTVIVIRVSIGQWIVGYFKKSIAHCHIMVELDALMVLYSKLIPIGIETSSVEVLQILQHPTSPYDNIVDLCRSLFRSLGNSAMQHNFCKTNRVVDGLFILGSKLTQVPTQIMFCYLLLTMLKHN